MMFKWVAATVAALCLAGAAAAQDTAAPEIWESMSLEQAQALAVEVGAVVDRAEENDEGGYSLHMTEAGGLFFELHGMQCQGVGKARTCPEFDMIAYFQAESAADAAAMAERVDRIWLNEAVVDDSLMVARMVVLHGGVTREHMRQMFLTFIDTIHGAYNQAFPQAAGESAVPPDHISLGKD